jgi:hypothetical protein
MIVRVFRREMTAFFRLKTLWVIFLLQPLFLAVLMGWIFSNLRPVLLLHPELLVTMASRQVSTLLVSFAIMSILHIFQKSIITERSSGLIDTLLTTPLGIRELVWGKALQLGALGYAMGMTLAIFNLAVLSYLVGDISLIGSIPPTYFFFALVIAPVSIVGILVAVVATSFVVEDVRLVVVPFTLGVMGLIGAGSVYKSMETGHSLILLLGALGLACHLGWWFLGGRITREWVLSR